MKEKSPASEVEIIKESLLLVTRLIVKLSKAEDSSISALALLIAKKTAYPIVELLEEKRNEDKYLNRAVYGLDTVWSSLKRRIDDEQFTKGTISVPMDIVSCFVEARFGLYAVQFKVLKRVPLSEAIAFYADRKLDELQQANALNQPKI